MMVSGSYSVNKLKHQVTSSNCLVSFLLNPNKLFYCEEETLTANRIDKTNNPTTKCKINRDVLFLRSDLVADPFF